MKKLFLLFSVFFLSAGLFVSGCMDGPEGPLGEPTAGEQQAAGAVATIISNVLEEDTDNVTSFTWNLFSDTSYENGWWHTSFSFELSSGDNGTLSIDANFQDAAGNNQMLPGGNTTRMETDIVFDGTFWTFPAHLNGNILLTREAYSNVFSVNATGALAFDTMNMTFFINELVLDLDVLYPVGTLHAHMVDEHLGEWDLTVIFNGTNIVEILMDNGVSTFTFTLDLSTGQIT